MCNLKKDVFQADKKSKQKSFKRILRHLFKLEESHLTIAFIKAAI